MSNTKDVEIVKSAIYHNDINNMLAISFAYVGINRFDLARYLGISKEEIGSWIRLEKVPKDYEVCKKILFLYDLSLLWSSMSSIKIIHIRKDIVDLLLSDYTLNDLILLLQEEEGKIL